MKKILLLFRSFLHKWGINVTHSLEPGLSIGSLAIRKTSRRLSSSRSGEALEFVKSLKPDSLIDVGSGGGEHARCFSEIGTAVTCVDFGTSVYAKHAIYDRIEIIYGDFNTIDIYKKFSVVWASHILEHQRNVGSFIEKLISVCEENGKVVITVPIAHRKLLGGHLTVWTPGLLAYNCVMAGVDLSDAIFIQGHNEFSVVFTNKPKALPESLTYDKGDLVRLKTILPKGVYEGSDSFMGIK